MGRRLAGGRQQRVWILLFLLATAAAGPLLFNLGFLNTRGGGDSPFLLFRLDQLVSALADGHFPVRWMPDAAYGLGYPFFSYYAALPFYVGAALTFVGVGLVTAVKLTQWLGFLLSAWAMWGLVRHISSAAGGRESHWAAWLAAVAYTFAPYHLVNVYVRGDSLTEFWAMGLYPLILWMAIKLWERPGWGQLGLFSLSYAALVSTHNISALIFSPFLLLFLLLLVLHKNPKRGGWLAMGLLLGLALSAFYWLPALGEQGAVQLDAQTSGYFHYSNHFRALTFGGGGQGLVQSSLNFDYEIAGRTPFSMGLVQAILTIGGLIAAALQIRRPQPGLPTFRFFIPVFSLLTLLISTLMITPASRFLWDHLPLLPLVQFPWRFLSIQALATALLISSLVPPYFRSRVLGAPVPISRFLTLAAITIIIAFTALADLHPDIISLTAADLGPDRLQLYEWFSGNVGTTIRNEYLPRTVIPRPYTSERVITGRPMKAQVLSGDANAVQLEKRTGRESWQVNIRSDSATIAFPTLYWPGWRARVDGERFPLRAAESLGRITLDLPAGEHSVALTLGRTPLRLAAELVSLLALLVCVVCLTHLRRRRPYTARRVLVLTLFVLLIGVILHLIPSPALPSDDLTWDLAQQAYLHPSPAGVPFGDAAVMQSYQITEQEKGGWDITIWWAEVSRPDLDVELSLVHPSHAYTLASDRQPLPLKQDQSTFSLPLPEAVPPGPLLPRLQLFDRDRTIPALTSAGRERGELYLRPVWVPAPSPIPLQEGGVQLSSTSVEQSSPQALAVTLRWVVGEPIFANYKMVLRLYDRAGNEWASLDTQPGYGFYPTGAWQPGTTFSEQLTLALTYGLPPGEYKLSVALYDATTLVPTWGPEEYSVTLTTATPYDGRPLLHHFTPTLAAAGLTHPNAIEQGDPLSFSVGWVTLAKMDEPVPLRWDLVDREGKVTASGMSELLFESGSFTLLRLVLATDPQTRAGNYLLRLTVPDGEPWEAAAITVRERERRFDLPEMETPLGVEFGEMIRLEGADFVQGDQVLTLTLYWRALNPIPADYLVFVHLYDPSTEQILVQNDAMPRSNRYPTSRWAAGEVVSDPMTLSLADIPSGRYRLGVGLYWQEGDRYPRLPAVDANGELIPAGRLVLPIEITVP